MKNEKNKDVKQLFEAKELSEQEKTCFHWSEPSHKDPLLEVVWFHFVIVAEYHTCSVGRLYLAYWCACAGPAVCAVLSIVH